MAWTARAGLMLCLPIVMLISSAVAVRGETQKTSIDAGKIDAVLSELVDSGAVTGVSALVYRADQEIYFGSVGFADREAGRPWRRDTLATLYSMTKPITGVTLMSLYEDGLFDLHEPLAKYLPEYTDVQVFAGTGSDGQPIVEAPRRPIKVIDIFRHTSCLGYGWSDHPVAVLMDEADVFDRSKPLAQMSADLAAIPLFCHPGEEWRYGASVDVQARLAEAVTGQSYEDIVTGRVLKPLGMSDTGYFVPATAKPRLAAGYMRDESGALTRIPDADVYGFETVKPVQINGGHGLISTIDDYMRFALMLQNEGTLDGVQILRPETIALMSRDHLPAGLRERDFLPTKGQVGFGLDFAVRIAPPASADEPYGVTGEFFWDGAASLLFWVDPKNDLTVVFYTQVMPFDLAAQAKFRRAVYDALDLIDQPRSGE